MKKREIFGLDFEVDFIGDQQNPLTTEEQLAISAFIKEMKEKRNIQALEKVQDSAQKSQNTEKVVPS